MYLQCGVTILETIQISVVFHVDDIVVTSESEDGVQQMLDKFIEWCSKWRIVINENKTNILHFRPKTKYLTIYNFICGEK